MTLQTMTTTSFRAAILITGALALGACTGQMERLSRVGQDPEMTQIQDPRDQDQYQPVEMPMPRAQEQEHKPNSLWRQGATGFFEDQRAGQVGDLLTVNIDITDQASLDNESERSRSSSESAGANSFFGLTGILEDILPADDADSGDLVDASSTSETSGSGSISREEDIDLDVAAVVTQILPNGNMVIQGRQETRVNAELRELIITGIVRPEDITSRNTVDYDEIAEARLSYGGRGQLSDVQRPRYGQELYDAVAPF